MSRPQRVATGRFILDFRPGLSAGGTNVAPAGQESPLQTRLQAALRARPVITRAAGCGRRCFPGRNAVRSAAGTSAQLEPGRRRVIPTETPAAARVLERLLTACPAYVRGRQVRRARCVRPRPAGSAGPAPPTCARTPTSRAARRRQPGPAPIYMVLFWSRALIGRPRVTTHSRAAGRGDIRGKSASGGSRGG